MKGMAFLILIRHGQSTWNAANLFTGWENVELSEKGILEAKKAAEFLSKFDFDSVFTSELIRAQKTAEIIIQGNSHSKPKSTIFDMRLNERHYGDLQGMNKDDARKKFGEEQVHIWRRSYDVPPPGGESLKDTGERVLPFFMKEILPQVCKGKNVLVAAHGNSLRSLIKFLDNISDEDIVKLEIPTGAPIHYVINEDGSVKSKKDFFNE